jgi:hypothetical protein
VQEKLRAAQPPEFFKLRHHDSVDRISATVLKIIKERFSHLFVSPDDKSGKESYVEKWWSKAYNADIEVVRPITEIDGVDTGFVRASRPNGSDSASWEDFLKEEGDYKKVKATNGVNGNHA